MVEKKDLLIFAHKAEASAFREFFKKNKPNRTSPLLEELEKNAQFTLLYCRTKEEISSSIPKALHLLGNKLGNIYCLGTAGHLQNKSMYGKLPSEDTKKSIDAHFSSKHTVHVRHIISEIHNATLHNISSSFKLNIARKSYLGSSPMATCCLLSAKQNVCTSEEKLKLGFYANLVDREFYQMAEILETYGQKAFFIKTISDEANENTNKRIVREHASLFSKRLLNAYLDCRETIFKKPSSSKTYIVQNKSGYESFLQHKLLELVKLHCETLEEKFALKLSYTQKTIACEKTTQNFLHCFYGNKNTEWSRSASPHLFELYQAWKEWKEEHTSILLNALEPIKKQSHSSRRKALLQRL